MDNRQYMEGQILSPVGEMRHANWCYLCCNIVNYDTRDLLTNMVRDAPNNIPSLQGYHNNMFRFVVLLSDVFWLACRYGNRGRTESGL